MQIGVCIIDLAIPGSHSLKEKRRVVKSIKDRVKNKFNVSIAEIDNLDRHQSCTIGIVCISNCNKQANRILSKIVDFIDATRMAEIERYKIEMIW